MLPFRLSYNHHIVAKPAAVIAEISSISPSSGSHVRSNGLRSAEIAEVERRRTVRRSEDHRNFFDCGWQLHLHGHVYTLFHHESRCRSMIGCLSVAPYLLMSVIDLNSTCETRRCTLLRLWFPRGSIRGHYSSGRYENGHRSVSPSVAWYLCNSSNGKRAYLENRRSGETRESSVGLLFPFTGKRTIYVAQFYWLAGKKGNWLAGKGEKDITWQLFRPTAHFRRSSRNCSTLALSLPHFEIRSPLLSSTNVTPPRGAALP